MTKIGKRLKIIIALFLTAILLTAFSACSCRVYKRSTFDYNAIKFEEIEASRLDADLANARDKIGSSGLALVGALNRLTETINAIAGNYQYAYVEYNKNTEGAYKEIYTRYDALYTEAYKKYFDLLYEVVEARDDIFDEEYKQIIIANHQTMDDEYLKLQNEITALETQYNALKFTNETAETYANSAAELLIQLVQKNNAVAEKASYDSYMDYAYAQYGRAYDTDDATAMTDYVKEYIGPLLKTAKASLDSASDSIAGFADSVNLERAVRGGDEIARNYGEVESHTAEIGDYMSEALSYLGECNLHYKATAEKNPNGTQGAFTTFLSAYEAPYIYQFCTGDYSDLMTFVHELGHFTAFYETGNGAASDLDVAEIHSQANEMLFLPRLKNIYGQNVGNYLIKTELFSSLYWSVTMGCLLDEFQRIIYADTETYSTAAAINGLFERLMTEYGAAEYGEELGARSGYDFNKYWWARVHHTFSSPFYYISYAISALPALTIYETSGTDRTAAITQYNAVQAFGNGTVTFDEVLTKARVASPFQRNTIKNLADFLEGQFAA